MKPKELILPVDEAKRELDGATHHLVLAQIDFMEAELAPFSDPDNLAKSSARVHECNLAVKRARAKLKKSEAAA